MKTHLPLLLVAFLVPTSSIAQAPDSKTGEMVATIVGSDGKEVRVPLFAPQYAFLPVARVDDMAIPLAEFVDGLTLSHQSHQEGHAKQHDFKPVLDRLINIKLMVAEAREMGLAELPEVRETVEREAEGQLIRTARQRAAVPARPDPKLVDRLYKQAVQEWQLRSVHFEQGEDAKAFLLAVKPPHDFVKEANRVIAEKKATGVPDASWVDPKTVLAQVFTAFSNTKPPAIRLVRTKEGWAVVQLLAVRHQDNPKARALAEEQALQAAQQKAVFAYYRGLEKRYARIDKKLLKSLDFEAAKPGFDALRKDKRVLARIEGEGPFTVADLAAGLDGKFFHGIEGPIKEKRVNAAKGEVFDTLLRRRLVLADARRLKLADAPEYKAYVVRFEEATLFAAYLERVLAPMVKVTDDEAKADFQAHASEFETPAMYKLESLTFGKLKDAQAALVGLQSGTDYKWMRANASGQVKEDERAVAIDGLTLSASGLPAGLRTQLSGAKVGDYRMQEISGQFYVVRLLAAQPAQAGSFEKEKPAIKKRIFGQKLEALVNETATKLRGTHDVAVYLKGIGY